MTVPRTDKPVMFNTIHGLLKVRSQQAVPPAFFRYKLDKEIRHELNQPDKAAQPSPAQLAGLAYLI